MLIAIPSLLTSDQVSLARNLIEQAEWEDGRSTAGQQSAIAKRNRQLAHGSEARQSVADMILTALVGKRLVHVGGASEVHLPATHQSL